MESASDQTVPSEETHCSLYVLSPGASHCVPYRRPNRFPLIQSSLLQLKQNAVDLPPCPSRLAVKNCEPSSWAGPCSYDTSLYSLPKPRDQNTSQTQFQSTKEHVASVDGFARHPTIRASMNFPCDLESSFHSGLLNSSTHSDTPSNHTERKSSTPAAGASAVVPTISDDPIPSTTTGNDLEQEFYSKPAVKHSSLVPVPAQTDSVLPLLFYPRRKTGQPMQKRRKVASSR